MNSTTQIVVESFVQEEDLLVSDEAKHYFRAIVQYGLQVTVICAGIATNVINVLVFVRAGLKDSVSVTFLGLAVSDLLHLLSYLVFRLVLMADFYFLIDSHIYPRGFGYPFSLYAIYFYDVSMYITVYAALQKCCCVVFPLKFKNTFTPRRAYVVIAAIFTATLVVFLPVLTGLPFVYKFNPFTNKSLLSVRIASHYRPSEYYWQSIVKIGLTPVSQLVVVVCLVIMTRQLRLSAHFRSESKAKSSESTPQPAALSKKELRALRAVQLVCFVFVVTSLPPTIASLVEAVYPPFASPRLLNLKHVVTNLIYFLGTVNASVNILFYLKFNSNYRKAFWESCPWCRGRWTEKSEVAD